MRLKDIPRSLHEANYHLHKLTRMHRNEQNEQLAEQLCRRVRNMRRLVEWLRGNQIQVMEGR